MNSKKQTKKQYTEDGREITPELKLEILKAVDEKTKEFYKKEWEKDDKKEVAKLEQDLNNQ